jgi:chromosome partitioning protein
MPVIAVINRKGGSGKSTFAAHVAAWCARQGHSVMLGDVDRQQSSRTWLRRRDTALPLISPWAMDNKNMLRVPTGITHVVLDTPGGIHGFELARIVMFADAIVMPVCSSMFDRESAAACHAELMALPRAASGRCRLAVVGMRIDGRTRAAEAPSNWSKGLGVDYLGSLRETQLYVRSLERGLTIFDLPTHQAATDLAQWDPILRWLRPILQAPLAANDAPPIRPQESRVGAARPDNLMPAQESLIHGTRLMTNSGSRATTMKPAAQARVLPRGGGIEGGQIPRFLKS